MLAGVQLPVFEKSGRILHSIHWRNQRGGLYKNEKFLFFEILLNTRKQ
jgi:hypothetical protein